MAKYRSPMGRAVMRQEPLADRQKEIMLGVLIRSQEAFELVKDRLQVQHFSGPVDRRYALVWEIVCDHYNVFKKLPTCEHIVGEIERRCVGYQELDESDQEEISDMLLAIFDLDETVLDVDIARSYLTAFLNEKLTDMASAVFSNDIRPPTNVKEVFQTLADEAYAIESLQSGLVEEPFADDWVIQPLQKIPSGLSFVDELMNGGQARKEVYGLLGPFGSCKTTLLLQLSVLAARRARRKWQAEGCKGPLGVVYYVQAEEPVKDMILPRALSFAAKIPRETFESATSSAELFANMSRTGRLKKYEMEKYAEALKAGVPVMGEYERYLAAREELNCNWRALDFSGADDRFPGRGTGLVPEISGTIKNDIRLRKGKVEIVCDSVYLDYAGAFVDRWLSVSSNVDEREVHRRLGKFPNAAKQLLAIQLDCFVWVAHQLSGEANLSAPGKGLHHAQASGNKSFGENCDFCFAIGTVSNDNLCTFRKSKSRRAAQSKDTVIEVDGNFAAVRSAGDRFVFDNSLRQFVSASDYNMLADAPSVPAFRPPVRNTASQIGS